MPTVIKKFLYSRKFWAFAAALVTAITAAVQDGAFSSQEIQNIVLLAVGYIFSVAWEDGKHAEAAGQVAAADATTQAAPPTVGIDANNVSVNAIKDEPPPVNRVGRMGL